MEEIACLCASLIFFGQPGGDDLFHCALQIVFVFKREGKLNTRRVAAADFQTVQRVEQQIEFAVFAESGRRQVGWPVRAGKRLDFPEIGQNVFFQHPDDIFEKNDPAVDGFQVGGTDGGGLVFQ